LARDAELAVAVSAGDREAEAELYRRLGPRVRLYGLRHLRDPTAADDLVQDVLLMTFDSLRAGKVRDPEHLASFVLGTCRRVVADRRRGNERHHRLLARYGADLVPVPSTEPPLDLERVARCLQCLSERERHVVIASFHAEHTAVQIAADLGLTAVNVRVLRHRALARLRACMEEKA
jgi:RNA polymerase sigma-70 factor (ECF subfamily)